MMLISVDLPAPFSPNSTCTSPRRRSKSTLIEREHAGKALARCRSSAKRRLAAGGCRRRRRAEPAPAASSCESSGSPRPLRRLDGIFRLEVGRRQHEPHVDLAQICSVRRSTGIASEDSCKVLCSRTRTAVSMAMRPCSTGYCVAKRQNLALVQRIEHRLVLIGGDDQLSFSPGLRDRADRRLRRRRAAPDHVHLGIGLQARSG